MTKDDLTKEELSTYNASMEMFEGADMLFIHSLLLEFAKQFISLTEPNLDVKTAYARKITCAEEAIYHYMHDSANLLTLIDTMADMHMKEKPVLLKDFAGVIALRLIESQRKIDALVKKRVKNAIG